MKNFFDSLFQTSHERMKNPFISSFLIALIVINWKPILIIILSGLKIEDRIIYTEENYINIETYLFLPLAVAIFYTLILPYLMMVINNLIKYPEEVKIIDTIKKEIKINGVRIELVQSEVALEIERSDSRNLSALNEQIENLKLTNKEKDQMVTNLQTDLESITIDFNKLKNKSIINNSLDFPDSGSDTVFRVVIEDPEKVKLLKDLGISYEKGIGMKTIKYSSKNDEMVGFFVNFNLIEVINKDKSDYYDFKLTNQGILLWKKLQKYHSLLGLNNMRIKKP